MKALILAAGFGTRLRPLTDLTSKVLVEVDDMPVIDHVLRWLRFHKVDPICINLHHQSQKVVRHLGYRDVLYSYEPKLMGTAGAIKLIGDWFITDTDEDFMVTNGDTITNLGLADMIREHKRKGKLATIFTHDDAINNGGTVIFKRQILDYIPKNTVFSLHEDLLPLIKSEVALYKSDAYYFDIGDKTRLEKVRRFFNASTKTTG